MSMRIQSQAQAADAAAQQALAPLTGNRAEAVTTVDEPQKTAGGLNAPAYTVEISDAAREKYAARERGAAAEEPQDGSTNAAQQMLTAANGANAAETAPAAANTENDAQRQIDSADAEEAVAANEEGGDEPNSPLDARLRKLRQNLADAKRAAVPDDEKKTRVAEIKRQIETLEGQIAAQQSHGA